MCGPQIPACLLALVGNGPMIDGLVVVLSKFVLTFLSSSDFTLKRHQLLGTHITLWVKHSVDLYQLLCHCTSWKNGRGEKRFALCPGTCPGTEKTKPPINLKDRILWQLRADFSSICRRDGYASFMNNTIARTQCCSQRA